MVRLRRLFPLIAGVSGVALILAGCSDPTAPPPSAKADTSGVKSDGAGDHGHKLTAHGGIVVPVGSDNYHAEAVFEKGGILRDRKSVV